MFFLLSKTAGLLVRPLTLILAAALAGLLLRHPKWKIRMRWAALGLFVFFSNEFIANEAMRAYEAPLVPIDSLQKTYEWGIVLTGVTEPDMDLKDRVYITSSPDRVNHTVMLYRLGLIRQILISGGSSAILEKDYREAAELRKVFITMGVNPDHIFTEEASRNTHENAVETARRLAGVPASECLLISSASHIPRAVGCFRKAGLPCDVFPTDARSQRRRFTPDVSLIPSVRAFNLWETLAKEVTGRLAYWIAGYTA